MRIKLWHIASVVFTSDNPPLSRNFEFERGVSGNKFLSRFFCYANFSVLRAREKKKGLFGVNTTLYCYKIKVKWLEKIWPKKVTKGRSLWPIAKRFSMCVCVCVWGGGVKISTFYHVIFQKFFFYFQRPIFLIYIHIHYVLRNFPAHFP